MTSGSNKHRIQLYLYIAIFLQLVVFTILLSHHIKYRNTYNKRGYIESFSSTREYHYFNQYSHYGDCILDLKFFYNIRDYLKQNNIIIHYYYLPIHIKNVKELERYADPDCILLYDTEHPETAIDLSIGNPNGPIYAGSVEKYYIQRYKDTLKEIGLADKHLDTSLYQDEKYMRSVYDKLDDKFKDTYILFINAKPKTDKFVYNKDLMDALAVTLSEKYKIVTTEPVNDSIPSTLRDGLNIQDIGAIATHATYIIAVHSGPIVACFNADTKKNVKQWFLLNAKESHIDHTEIPVTYIEGAEDFPKIIEYITTHTPVHRGILNSLSEIFSGIVS